MATETCLKCSHVNPAATGAETEACPQCGAIYARVKAAAASGRTVRPARTRDSGFPASRTERPPEAERPANPQLAPDRKPQVHRAPPPDVPYVERLRARTNYPTFRAVVRFGLYFGYLLTAAALLGGIFAAFRPDGSVFHLLIAAGIGAALYLLTRIWFELTVMIVDLADASVRTAENCEPTAPQKNA